LKEKSGAHNLHLSPDSNPNCDFKNLYVEGNDSVFLKVKELIEDIIM